MNRTRDMLKNFSAAEHAAVMGIVNAAPDSFSDGNDGENPVCKALRLLDEGADIIDIGGESTRPGAADVDESTETQRILSVLVPLRKLRPDAVISIDTRKSHCAKIALDNGADIINDVSGLTYSADMAKVIAEYKAYAIIMHSLAGGKSDKQHVYSDVCREVADFLQQQKLYAIQQGILQDRIIIDPGLGFSKNTDENFALLSNIKELRKIAPVLIGHSRKRFIREFCGISDIAESDGPTAMLSVLAALEGSAILRVHNVKNTVRYLNLAYKMRNC